MTERDRMLIALTASARGPVDHLIAEGSTRILVAHVTEEDFGLGQAVVLALREAGARLLDLNPAYLPDAMERIAGGESLQDILSMSHAGDGPAVVWLTGWGSRPHQADEILKVVAPIVEADPDLRLALLNNASAIPVQFPEHGPAAWTDAEAFARHVASLAGIDRNQIDLWIPGVDHISIDKD